MRCQTQHADITLYMRGSRIFFFKGGWVGWVVRWIFEFAGGAYFRLFYYTILNWESSYFLGRPGCTVALTHVPNGVFSPVPSFNWLSDCHIQLLLNRLQYKENPTNQGWSVTSIQHQQIYNGSLLSAVIATLEDALMIKGMINSHSLNLWFQTFQNQLHALVYKHQKSSFFFSSCSNFLLLIKAQSIFCF